MRSYRFAAAAASRSWRAEGRDLVLQRLPSRVASQAVQVVVVSEIGGQVEARFLGAAQPLEGFVLVPLQRIAAGDVVGRGVLAVARFDRLLERRDRLVVTLAAMEVHAAAVPVASVALARPLPLVGGPDEPARRFLHGADRFQDRRHGLGRSREAARPARLPPRSRRSQRKAGKRRGRSGDGGSRQTGRLRLRAPGLRTGRRGRRARDGRLLPGSPRSRARRSGSPPSRRPASRAGRPRSRPRRRRDPWRRRGRALAAGRAAPARDRGSRAAVPRNGTVRSDATAGATGCAAAERERKMPSRCPA